MAPGSIHVNIYQRATSNGVRNPAIRNTCGSVSSSTAIPVAAYRIVDGGYPDGGLCARDIEWTLHRRSENSKEGRAVVL
jgi:hypothetical protein